jgi:hypothetical protein
MSMLRPRSLLPYGISILALTVPSMGCQLILGIGDEEPLETGGSGGTGGSAASGGSAGSDGTAGAGGMLCRPGVSEIECYSGDPGTKYVGACWPGVATCQPDGLSYGPCEGEVLPALEDCTAEGDEDCDGFWCSETAWAKVAGDASGQGGHGVGVDGMGNIYLTGGFAGALDLGAMTLIAAGSYDIFLVKLGPTGNLIWAKQFGNPQSQDPGPLVVDSAGNVILTGFSTAGLMFGPSAVAPGIYAAKFAPDGAHLWSKGFGGTNSVSEIADIDVDASDDLVLAGAFNGTVNFGNGAMTSAGSLDAFLVKLAGASGDGIWSRRFGDANEQRGSGVAVDAGGNVLFTARHEGATTFGGPVLMSAGAFDVVVAKFDAVGNHSWSERYGDAETQIPHGLAVDALGNAYVTGQFGGTIDFGGQVLTGDGQGDVFVTKLSNVGNHVWSSAHGSADYDAGMAVHVDAAGSVLVYGNASGPLDFGGPVLDATLLDIFLTKLTSDGQHVWSRLYGGPNLQVPIALATAPSNHIVITGSTGDEIDLGLGPLATGGSTDLFIAKVHP